MKGRVISKVVALALILTFLFAGMNMVEANKSKQMTIMPLTFFPTQVTDLLATPHEPTNADVQLEWTESGGAIGYNIYRSTSVRGDGFDFLTPYANVPGDGSGKIIWVDSGAYADASNYSWVVKVITGAGENQTCSNPAWKLVYNLRKGIGVAGADLNYISLPYRLNITSGSNVNTAGALIEDMRAYGSPVNSVSSVNRWDQNASMWQTRVAVAGTNFALKPGEGYRVVVSQPAVTYKIVGAYDASFTNILFKGTGMAGADSNYISLPYHYSFTSTAAGLLSNMRTTGIPTNAITSVNKWNQDTSMWEARTPVGGFNFVVKPGECYRAIISSSYTSMTWTCPVRVPGA